MAAIREEPKSDYRVNGALGAGPTKNLILTEQELRFAGQTLRSVLSGNVNGYVSWVQLLKIISKMLKNVHLLYHFHHHHTI